MSLLEVRDLSISFRSGSSPVKVVSDLSFSIAESEVVGIAGESGSGKSVTALSILGILPPVAFAEGSILFRGQNLMVMKDSDLRRVRGREISMVFQEPMTSLNPVLTVGFQVAEPLMIHQGLSRKASLERAVDLLKEVRIPSPELRVKEYPHQMSGGMRQRVMIAMALACNPLLLIADEPTTALDVTIQAQILDLLKRLRESHRMSMLLITHDLGIIAGHASRVAIMYAGRLMETAKTEELFRRPLHPYTRGLLGSLPKSRGQKLEPIPGFVPSPRQLPKGCSFSDRCSFVMDACRVAEPQLVEISASHSARCIRAGEFA